MREWLSNWIWLIVFCVFCLGFGIGGWSASNQIPAKQQTQRASTAHSESEPRPSAIPQRHTEQGHTQTGEEKEPHTNGFWTWVSNFFEVKLTDLLIAAFTIVLAIKTSGLFRETAGLRSAADKQSIDMQASIAVSRLAANAATKGARAAETSATALMDAERAHIYAMIYTSSPGNIGAHLLAKSADMQAPFEIDVWYHLTNHGRSPAVITDVQYGITIEKRVQKREYVRVWENIMDNRNFLDLDQATEIIEAGKMGSLFQCKSDLVLSLEEAGKLTNPASENAIFFYGLAFFIDSFGQRHVAKWEYMYADRQWLLMAYKGK